MVFERDEVGLVPRLMYGSECCVWQAKHESRIDAVKMRSLRCMCGVTLNYRLRNEAIRECCGLKEDVVTKIEKSMLRWIGHWFACIGTSDEQTRPGSEPPPSVTEWLYRIARKIIERHKPYHNDNVGTQSAGMTRYKTFTI